MDFAFLSVADVNQAYSTPTVFSETARFSQQQRRAEVSSRNVQGVTHMDLVESILNNHNLRGTILDVAAEIKIGPELILDREWRGRLRNKCEEQISENKYLCPNELTSQMWVSGTSLLIENVFFMAMKDFYWSLNILVICIFFMLNLIVVDLKVFLNAQ